MKDNTNIMSVSELIDTAFGDTRLNIVNHKLIQTILVILAKQLRLLERRVEVKLGPNLEMPSATSISVTEVKILANATRKKKYKVPPTTDLVATGSKGATKSKKSRQEKTQTPSSAKVSLESSAYYDKTSSSVTKSTTYKSTSDKTSTEDQTSSNKTSLEKTGSDRMSTIKTSSEKWNLIPETTKSSSAKTYFALDSTNAPYSADKTRKDRSATEHSSADITSTTSEPSAIDKPSKEILIKSSELSSTKKIIIEKSKQDLLEDHQKLLENIEIQRERELRIIHQRTDSREERNRTPTPMASMDSIEKKYEKLLIVESVPTDGKKAAKSGSQTGLHEKKTPTLAIVTQDEFEKLTKTVCKLQEKIKTVGAPGFPENAQLFNDLRKGASLTDAMSALQLSARVEAVEKALEKMISLVTDLASNSPEINIEEFLAKCQRTYSDGAKETIEDIFGATVAQFPSAFLRRKSILVKEKKLIAPKFTSNESIQNLSTLKAVSEKQLDPQSAQQAPPPEESNDNPDTVTYKELDIALQELYDDCVKMVITSTNRSNANANNALKIANRLEETMDISSNLGGRTSNLEKSVSKYAEQIIALDAGLSSQMSVYQEQLTQMQHNLESGLETMAETLANTGGDTAAIADLNQNFRNLQGEIDTCASKQNELRDMQDVLSMGLQSLWKEIEILRATKSDRDEVDDALRDKAGLGDLNGLVSQEEFVAVRGHFEKRIDSAYERFHVEEIVWQKSIDELVKELYNKADWIQVVSLQDSINQYLNKLKAKIRAMEEVVGEPNAAAITRILHRGAECLSCGTAAHMNLEEPKTVPLLPKFISSRPPAVGAESESKSKPQEDGDHGGVCYPGLPIPHKIDPRAHVCHRYCGGSHTLINNTLSRAPASMIVEPAVRQLNTIVGIDGKPYVVDEDEVKEPCIPCKVKTSPQLSEDEPAFSYGDFTSDMSSFDFLQTSKQAAPRLISHAPDNISMTPPLTINND